MELSKIIEHLTSNDHEICGYINSNDENILVNKGKNIGEGKSFRGSCEVAGSYLRQWHTHPHTLPFYPSPEDIFKVLCTDVTESKIFTAHGWWHLKYNIKLINLKQTEIIKGGQIYNMIEWYNSRFGHLECERNLGLKPKLNAKINEYIHDIIYEVFIKHRLMPNSNILNMTWNTYY